MFKYQYHTYKKKGDGHPNISSVNIKTPLSLYLFFINNQIAGFTTEGNISITMIDLYSDTSPTSAEKGKDVDNKIDFIWIKLVNSLI